jgi:putative (di)nucleoside polyphosphate hydrolase
MNCNINLPYRRGVGMMMLNAHGNVFIARRIDTLSDAWQMPQGGIDEGEAPRDAALRELEEEIGTRNATIIGETAEWLNYDLPDALVPVLWNGRFRGQTQKWFCLRFHGHDSEINIATQNPEFLEWKWTSIDSLPDVIVPFKRALYQRIVNEFSKFADADITAF